MKHCDNCLRVTYHDHVAGHGPFPGYYACGYCGWVTPDEDNERTHQ